MLLNPFRLPKSGKAFGEGRAVLVIPGLTTGDISTSLASANLAQARGFSRKAGVSGINTGADAAKLKKLEQAHCTVAP